MLYVIIIAKLLLYAHYWASPIMLSNAPCDGVPLHYNLLPDYSEKIEE